MTESVAVAKEADAKKGFSPTRSDNSISRLRDEHERQLGSLRGVIGNITRNGGTPSVENIATELSGMPTAQRAPALLALQQTHGNRYVQRVVSGIQAKLVVGQPGDKYEQEADRVADAVMRMPELQVQRQIEEEEEEERIQTKPLAEQITPLVQRQVEEEEKEEEILRTKEYSKQSPAVSSNLETNIQSLKTEGTHLPESIRAFFEPRFGHDFSEVKLHTNTRAAELARTEITPLMQRQENLGEEKEEELIQTKIARDVTPEVTPAISSGIQSLQGGGRPLSGTERSFFEPRFGADFSNVRVHNDTRAANVARSVNARAFTFGHNVVFGAGEYSPDALTGRKLLAHELTHVVQQNGGPTLFSAGKNSMNTILNSQKFSVVSTEFIQQGTAKPGVGHDSADSVISRGSADAASRRLIQRSFTPLAPGGGFRGLIERDRRRVPGRPASTLPWIDVRSGPAAFVGLGGHGFDHLFIIETDTSARELFYRGGIGNRCAGTWPPFYGISTDSGPYLPGTVDWHPGAPSVTVATGAAAMGKGSCCSSQLARIRASCTSYNPLGPNSNTVVKTLLANCGLPLRKPAGSWAPGWGHAPL